MATSFNKTVTPSDRLTTAAQIHQPERLGNLAEAMFEALLEVAATRCRLARIDLHVGHDGTCSLHAVTHGPTVRKGELLCDASPSEMRLFLQGMQSALENQL